MTLPRPSKRREARSRQRAAGAAHALALLALLLGSAFGACAPLPSRVPLGGEEQSDAPPAASNGTVAVTEEPDEGDAPAPPPPPREAPVAPPASASAPPVASAAPAPASKVCNPREGTPAPCSSVRPPPPSEECYLGYAVTHTCEMATRVLLAKPAAALVACLQRHSGSQALCSEDTLVDCMLSGFAAGCPDPAAAALCKDIWRRCPPRDPKGRVTEKVCADGVAALEPGARKRFEACIQQACSIELCAAQVLEPTGGDGPPPIPPPPMPPPGSE